MTTFYPEGSEPEAAGTAATPAAVESTPEQAPEQAFAPAPESADVADPGAPRTRRRGLVIAGAASGAVVLALGAGAAYLYLNLGRGATSPQGAVERLVNGAVDGNLIAVGAAISPSERDMALAMGDRAREMVEATLPEPEVTASAQVDFTAILDAVEVSVADVEYVTEDVVEGVSLVRVEAGTVTADVDKAPFVDAVMEQLEASGATAFEDLGYDDAMLDEARAELGTWVDETFPWTFDIAEEVSGWQESDAVPTDASPIAFMTVEEGGWYVSPLLTVAEAAASANLEPGDRGTAIADAVAFATPEEAATGTAAAVEEFFATGDAATLAAVLPLPERRIVSLYGEAVLRDATPLPAVALDVTEVAATVDGDVASAELVAFDFSFDLQDGMTAPTSGTYRQGCVTADGAGEICVADIPMVGQTGIDDISVTLMREGDGWLMSPTMTLVDYSVRVSAAYSEMLEDGSLDGLLMGE
ncbi:hypothetical protein [Demequina silvatica]|uniref:hypothetical protein n=1 Tax=Demequina silvatica TaxID=1638988 RepID=UPI00078448CD|nr:hypothetical protein [Demequina silvatica]